MVAVRSSIPLLRFCAGPLSLGIAAEDVVSVTPEVDESDIHIAKLFGVDPGDVERRTIQLSAGLREDAGSGADSSAGSDTGNSSGGNPSASCSFQADMPLNVVQCEVEQILPLPEGVPAAQWQPVMGFAQIAGQVVLLLDIPSVVDTLMHIDRIADQRGPS